MTELLWKLWAAAVVATVALLCQSSAIGQKGGKGGGDSAAPSGVVYYYYWPSGLVSMNANGANKTTVGVTVDGFPIGDAIPSRAKHDDMRWFLQAYTDLRVTNEANETITLYSAPENFYIAQMRWDSDPVAGPDAYVSWWEYLGGDENIGVLVRAPVVYGDDGEIIGLDLDAAEPFYGLSWDYDWSPDGTEVVYRDGSELWIYNTLTDMHVRLPTAASNQPRWSPDGTRIVYGAQTDNSTSIETIKLNDQSITVIASARNRGVNGKYVNNPLWSPDGKFIVYRHIDASSFDWYQDIVRRTHDGKNPTSLTGDVKLSYIPLLHIRGWTLE